MTLKIETIVNGPFVENCFVVWDDQVNRGILIDPGEEPEKILQTVQLLGVKIDGIYLTHGHIDHVGAVAGIVEKIDVPVALHPADNFIMNEAPAQAKMFGLPPKKAVSATKALAKNDTFKVGRYMAKVIVTPGHTPGGVCFLFDKVIFVGDTLFSGSIGRSDLPGGSHSQLIDSIKTQLMTLDSSIKVFCGHGSSTTIGKERSSNPFL